MEDPVVEKLPVAAAAKAVGQPERSLFRAVEKGWVPYTRQDGVTVVAVADAQAWAAQRTAARQGAQAPAAVPSATAMAAPATPSLAAPATATAVSMPSAHGGMAGGSGRPVPGVLDGETAALLFAAFREGETPTDIVERLRVPPAVAGAAYRQYLELQGLTTSRSPLLERVDRIEAQMQSMAADLDAIVYGHAWTGPMLELRQGLEQVRAWVTSMAQRR